MLKCSELDKSQLSLFGTVQHSNNKTSKKKQKTKEQMEDEVAIEICLGKMLFFKSG